MLRDYCWLSIQRSLLAVPRGPYVVFGIGFGLVTCETSTLCALLLPRAETPWCLCFYSSVRRILHGSLQLPSMSEPGDASEAILDPWGLKQILSVWTDLNLGLATWWRSVSPFWRGIQRGCWLSGIWNQLVDAVWWCGHTIARALFGGG